ncbi:hypothetical protein BDV30DRAFT_61382 [Aspergillus minisclerotigenes]|uniref:Uncharacterized protein n=1 Tax=Aspergillus minisclerotigenes TaxID=656917 RepID=A0A5N6IKY1_9EURO|nr:hypothetical protein BDV30DRAFT_61382 [Aspergillus minisclerotigenes]
MLRSILYQRLRLISEWWTEFQSWNPFADLSSPLSDCRSISRMQDMGRFSLSNIYPWMLRPNIGNWPGTQSPSFNFQPLNIRCCLDFLFFFSSFLLFFSLPTATIESSGKRFNSKLDKKSNKLPSFNPFPPVLGRWGFYISRLLGHTPFSTDTGIGCLHSRQGNMTGKKVSLMDLFLASTNAARSGPHFHLNGYNQRQQLTRVTSLPQPS